MLLVLVVSNAGPHSPGVAALIMSTMNIGASQRWTRRQETIM